MAVIRSVLLRLHTCEMWPPTPCAKPSEKEIAVQEIKKEKTSQHLKSSIICTLKHAHTDSMPQLKERFPPQEKNTNLAALHY